MYLEHRERQVIDYVFGSPGMAACRLCIWTLERRERQVIDYVFGVQGMAGCRLCIWSVGNTAFNKI